MVLATYPLLRYDSISYATFLVCLVQVSQANSFKRGLYTSIFGSYPLQLCLWTVIASENYEVARLPVAHSSWTSNN